MKCRQCDNEAVYADGLCESCHARQQEDVQVMSVLSGTGLRVKPLMKKDVYIPRT